MNILLTAFQPFGDARMNQSEEVIKTIDLPFVSKVVLPVTYQHAFEAIEKIILTQNFTHILSIGEGPNQVLHLEHIAVNIMHARIPDNHHFQPRLKKINDTFPISLPTTFPMESVGEHLQKNGVKFEHSFHAGTYVCNDLYYRLLLRFPNLKIGFIHVPNQPNLIENSVKGIKETLTFTFAKQL
jgi:pyroglutamyl-peptidase